MNRLATVRPIPHANKIAADNGYYSRNRTCSLEGCDQKHSARGLCQTHARRLALHGDPYAGIQYYRSPEEALRARTRTEGDCRIWTGFTKPTGYGSIWNGETTEPVHRFAWKLANGPIPDRLVIDHLCWNRACVNTEHLRAIPQRNNASYRSGGDPKSKTGLRNITVRPNGRYQVSVNANGKRHYGGLFDDIEEAKSVADAMRNRLFGEYAGRG